MAIASRYVDLVSERNSRRVVVPRILLYRAYDLVFYAYFYLRGEYYKKLVRGFLLNN